MLNSNALLGSYEKTEENENFFFINVIVSFGGSRTVKRRKVHKY